MSRTTYRGPRIEAGEVKTDDLGVEVATEAKLVSAVASTLKFQDLSVTDAKLPIRSIPTSKLVDDYVMDGDVVDIGGTTLLTTPTLEAETSHISIDASEIDPATNTEGIPLDGASHVCWAFADASLTSASYQGWLYTTALGWIQIPALVGALSSGDAPSDSQEVSGAERFALPVAALTGTDPSVLRILKAVTT